MPEHAQDLNLKEDFFKKIEKSLEGFRKNKNARMIRRQVVDLKILFPEEMSQFEISDQEKELVIDELLQFRNSPRFNWPEYANRLKDTKLFLADQINITEDGFKFGVAKGEFLPDPVPPMLERRNF